MEYLVRIDDEAALDPARVGPKFVGLARASRAGLPVPPAVAVGTRAQQKGASSADLAAELELVAAEIGVHQGVSVRSSATLEDLSGHSFAGVYETALDVIGLEAVLGRIAECRQSAAGEVAAGYLEQVGLAGETPAMAVIVQRMVPAVAAGVAFSADPRSPGDGRVVIEAVRGLGDRLVSGHVSPWRCRVGEDGQLSHELPSGDQSEAPLSEEQWRQVAGLVRRVAESFGDPQDVEWAMDREGRIWLLQARPITGLAEAGAEVPPGRWTRRIAVDLWADQLTPFLGDHMVRNAARFDFSAVGRFLGMPVTQPTLAVVRGFLYVNCAALEGVLSMVPRRLRVPELVELFPPGTDTDAVPEPGWRRLAAVALRATLRGLLHPGSTPLLCEPLARRGLVRLGGDLAAIEARPSATPEAALARAGEAGELLARLQVRNQWPYLYATVGTVVLRRLAERYGLGHGEFLRRISGGTNNVSGEIERRFRRLAERVGENRALVAKLESGGVRAPGDLPAGLRQELEQLLDSFGCRSRHRSLTYRRWAEAPEEALGMLRALLGRSPAESRHGDAETAEAQPRREIGLAGRLLLGIAQRFARRHLDLREDLRFFLDRILFALRRSLLDLGESTGLGEEVFFLTAVELQEMLAGRLERSAARRLASGRRRRLEAQREAASFLVDGRPVEEDTATGDLLRGVGTSPGRRSGRARILDDPAAVGAAAGDVLVASNTDPGWTPVLSAVSAVVVEEGGLLNHCSIVARELGIPAVVGVRGATRAIPDGARVTVDGDGGTVRIHRDESS